MKTHLQTVKIFLLTLVLGAGVAVRAQLPSPNSGMATIPAGWFWRGDFNDNNLNGNAPTNQVYVDAFQMDTNLISYSNWQLVYQYGINNGYSFSTNASGLGLNHPVQKVNWYDVVKWCNARSQMENLTPCYYTDGSLQTVYITGTLNLTSSNVNWAANGYRLPTEAEWEKAARGGLTGYCRFPLTNTISHSYACYSSPLVLAGYDLGPKSVVPSSTVPVGNYKPNGYGLYDMAGNVQEWCWDFYSSTYYRSTSTNNPVGPATGTQRVTRGGDWNGYASGARCAARNYVIPSVAVNTIGFRCVRAASPSLQAQTISFNPIPNHVYGDGSINLTSFATGGGSSSPLIFTNTGQANISGNVLTFTGAGLVTVTANQAGDATYSAAPPVSRNFTVTPTNLTITANPRIKQYGQIVTFGSGSIQFTSSGLQNNETIASVTLACSGGAATNEVSGSPYTITPSAATGGGSFNTNNYSINYNPGYLTVSKAVLTVAINPSAQTITNGASAAFTNTVSGGTPADQFQYQWRFNNGADISGATNQTLAIPHVGTNDEGSYTVVVMNNNFLSETSAPATLTVACGVGDVGGVTFSPKTLKAVAGVEGKSANKAIQTVPAGSTATFTVTAYGSPPLRYQWQLNGSDLINNSHISGAINNSLTISNIQPSDAGQYSVAVGDPCIVGYRLTNQVLSLAVTQAFSLIVIVSQPQTQTANNGASVTFTLGATNSTGIPMTYFWHSIINGVTNWVQTVGPTFSPTSSYSAGLAGSYFCVVSNQFDIKTSGLANLWLASDPLLSVGVSGLVFGVSVSGPVGGRCMLDYTADLTTPVVWHSLTNMVLTLTNSPQVIVDQESVTNHTQRFYRVNFLP